MSWTYLFDRIDTEVYVDSASENFGRATFYRYLYFKPSNYLNWSKTGTINLLCYSALLINDSNIPSAGTYLSGSLSAYYLAGIEEISNLCTEENPQAVSYGVVKLLYENQPNKSSGSSSSSSSSSSTGDKEPWKKVIEDFTQTTVENTIPLKYGYNSSTSAFSVPIQNSARQPFLNVTTSIYGSKYTWTYYTKESSLDYSHTLAWVNTNSVAIGDSGVTVQPYTGLFLPPTKKRQWFIKNSGSDRTTAYYIWTFEVIVNPLGHRLTVYDAGTKMLDTSSQQLDICTWYVEDPQSSNPIRKQYGSVKLFINAKNSAINTNLSRSEQNKITVTGDLTNSPVPLRADGGIDTAAIAGTAAKRTLTFAKYIEKSISASEIGWR